MLIDTPTAWSILCTPLGIAAGLGWIQCARMLAKAHKALKIARDTAAHKDGEAASLLGSYRSMTDNYHRVCTHLGAADIAHEDVKRNMQMAYSEDLHDACSKWEAAEARATDLEDRLRKIEQARHASAKHARAAQIAQRKAAIAATTAKLRDELQAAQPAERLAA